ncbi:protein phosphatase 2C domain-containing protein [Streptomyces collinus]|uniref:protein phosphatase 2C domain-containing protein n=1 Tax=Streptomyces collinus TaxID=42684 RepID=UPI0036B7FD40
MSQQGGRPTGHEDDWWRELYDDSTDDTGPTPARDSLDDRFASASGAVGDGTEERTRPPDRPAGRPFGAEPTVPAPRTGPDDVRDTSRTGPDEVRDTSRTGADEVRDTSRTGADEVRDTSRTGPDDVRDTSRPNGRPPQRAPWEPPPEIPRQPPAPAVPGSPPAAVPPPPAAPPSWPAVAADPPGHPAPPAPATEAGGAASPAAGFGEAPYRAPASGPPVPPRPAAPPVSSPPTHQPPLPPGPGIEPASPADRTPEPPDPPATGRIERPAPTPGARGHVGTRPPTYDAEPTALPAADPDDLDDLVADTVLDGARYGTCTLRAVSVRGDSARYRGEPRRDALLTARFGTGERALLLVAMATGARATPGAHRAAAEACHWIGRAVGRSHARLVEDIRDGRRGDLKSGLHRLTDRSLGKLRASASEQGVDPGEYAASLRCLLLSADPGCRTRVFFGVGPGGLFRLREGEWQDIEPQVTEVKGEPVLGFGSPPSETPEGDRLTMDLGIPTPPSPYEPAPEPPREPFRFRTSVARPGDTLLMCSGGLADPLRGEPELGEYLAERWSRPDPPGLAEFLADSQVRVKGYADDRTAAAVWEA